MKLRLRELRWMSPLVVAGVALLLLAGPVSAATIPIDDDILVSELEAGESFESPDGSFTFSDFDFTAVGFDDSLFDTFFVRPEGRGFFLVLGFTSPPFGPGSLEMSYRVSGNPGSAVGSVRIGFLGLLNEVGEDPLARVDLTTSNGVALSGSTPDFTSWVALEAFFDPQSSLVVNEVVTLSGGEGTVKLFTDFKPVPKDVPEPGTGLMLALGLGAWMTLRPRGSA